MRKFVKGILPVLGAVGTLTSGTILMKDFWEDLSWHGVADILFLTVFSTMFFVIIGIMSLVDEGGKNNDGK